MRIGTPSYVWWFRVFLIAVTCLLLLADLTTDLLTAPSFVCLTLLAVPLVAVTWLKDPFSLVLAVTLVIFFYLRALLLPLLLGNFTYPDVSVDADGFSQALAVLLVATWALLCGSVLGGALISRRARLVPRNVLPFQGLTREPLTYYRAVVWLYLMTVVPLTILRLVTGVGIAGTNDLIESRAASVSYTALSIFVISLGVAPVLWRMHPRTRNSERLLTSVGIGAYVISCVLSFSKTALMYALLPALCVLLVYYRPIPRRLLKIALVTVVLTLVSGGAFAALRSGLRDRIVAGQSPGLPLELAFRDPGDRDMLGDFAKRLGSSFDVLYSVVARKAEFLPYLDVHGELGSSVNALFPVWRLDLGTYKHPAVVLPIVLRGLSEESLGGHGENINVINLTYLYLGLPGMAFALFLIGASLAVLYGRSHSLAARVFILSMSISWVSNGGNLGDLVTEARTFIVGFLVAVMIANVHFVPVSLRRLRSSPARVASSRN